MTDKQLGVLIEYIVSQVDELGGYTTTIRLVKFLYLIDLEHYRRRGQTLTGLDWVFYRFGPYAFVIKDIGKRIGYDLETEEFVNRRGQQGTLLRPRQHKDYPAELGENAQTIIDGILGVWADRDTSEILDYVYRETEPMIKRTRNEKLDFKIVERETRYYEFYVPTNKDILRRLRDSISSYDANAAEGFVPARSSTLEENADDLKPFNEEDEYNGEISGVKPDVDLQNLYSTLSGE